jgi:Zn-dependent protease with chaperone function
VARMSRLVSAESCPDAPGHGGAGALASAAVSELPVGVRVMDETFFTAQRRHRRTARLYTVLAAVAAVLQGIPIAVILAPVVLGVAVLVTDVVNLWHPTPDLAEAAGRVADALGPRQEASGNGASPEAVVPASPAAGTEVVRPIPAILLVVVPGLVAMCTLWWLVRRFLLRDGLGGVLLSAGARPPNHTDAEEHQLVNIVEEMSIAAGIRTPCILVLPAEVPNAAAFGQSPKTWTIAVSRGLLDDLDRDATQGVVAHLVGSVGNGDLRMQHSLLSLYMAHRLAQDLLTLPFASAPWRRVWRVSRLLRGKTPPEEEAETIRQLLVADDDNNIVASINFISFKLVQLYTNFFVVGGILTLPFRARRYLADATAVRLTRTPNGIGHALVHLRKHGKHLPGAGYAAIYTVAVAHGKPQEETVEDALALPASLHPSTGRRVSRLYRLGYRGDLPDVPLRARPRVNWPRLRRLPLELAVYTFLSALCAPFAAVLLAMVVSAIALSIAIGFLFWAAVTAVIVLPLHEILRDLA